MQERKAVIRQIKNSLDMAVYRRELFAIAIGAGLGLFFGWLRLREYGAEFVWIFAAVMAVLLSPAIVVTGYRMWKLLREPEEYFFTRVKLASPHQKWWRGAMYFTVVIEDPEEGTVAADTNPIFFAYGFEPPLMEDYLNKTVPIAYNRATGMVVVLK